MSRSALAKWSTAPMLIGALIAGTACSSSSSSTGPTTGSPSGAASTASGSASTDGVSAAAKFIAPFSALGSSINLTVPLTAKPPTGKKVFVVANADPNTGRIVSGIKQATDALGWTLKVLSYTGVNPSDANGLILQAVQQGADYIAYGAVPVSVVQSGINAAKAKNIPVFEQNDATAPEGAKNWIFSNVGGVDMFSLEGKISADSIIASTNGKANTLLVNVPAFAVLKAYADSMKAEFAKNCPACGFASLDVQYADVAGGKLPSEVVSYLRSHTTVDHVIFGTGGFSVGFATAAAAAGIKIGDGGVQILSQAPETANLQAIVSGKEISSIAIPQLYTGWLLVDAMARQSLGMDLTPNWNTVIPLLIETKSTITDPTARYEGPTGFQDQFKALWKLT